MLCSQVWIEWNPPNHTKQLVDVQDFTCKLEFANFANFAMYDECENREWKKEQTNWQVSFPLLTLEV